jgi:dTDP-glucose 4,6-dehydratase
VKAIVTGGAGFLGSHLCERLLGQGDEVVCIDNLLTGSAENVAHLLDLPGMTFLRRDVTVLGNIPGPVDAIFHLASPASPRDYLTYPIETLRAGSLGTQLPGIGEDKAGPVPAGLHQRDIRRPAGPSAD